MSQRSAPDSTLPCYSAGDSVLPQPPSPASFTLLDQFEALRVEAVPLPAGHGLQQSLLLLGAAGRLQLIHSGQVEEDTLVEVECGVLLNQTLKLAKGLLQTAQVQQAHRCIVVGLATYGRREEQRRTSHR